jgi:hypothetical protein
LVYLDSARRLTTLQVDMSAPAFRAGIPTTLLTVAYSSFGPWRSYDVTPDGQKFLVMKRAPAVAPQPAAPGFIVVQHWIEELRRLLPTP